MKILWTCHRDPLNPLAGGAERVVGEIGTRLVQRGHELTILTGGFAGAAKSEVYRGILVRRFGNRILPHIVHPIFIQLHQDTDVIIDDLGHAAPWFTPLVSSKPNIALFYHRHSKSLGGQTGPALAAILGVCEREYSLIYRRSKFVTISESSRHDLQNLGVPADAVHLIHLGADSTLFHPGKRLAVPQLVYFGGLRPYKRGGDAIRVLEELQRREVQATLVVVGDGPQLGHLRDRVERAGLTKRVRFTGRLSDSDLAAVVRQSWINLHFSKAEGLCLSAIEASCAGVPTIAYRNSSMEESVADGVSGRLVPDGDILAAAGACVDVIPDIERWSEQSARFSERFSWNRATDDFEVAIRDVVRSG